jgi:hypothetical protein
MFDSLESGGYDVWNWRSLTTAAAFLAEGMTYDTANGFDPDASGQLAYRPNPGLGGGSVPTYIHQNGSAFTGYILYTTEDMEIPPGFSDWILGQTIPGWRIDSSVVNLSSAIRGSRWDIRTVSEYDDGADQYIVVLCRPLNTGFSVEEDLNMALLDSVEVKIGITDNQMSIETEGSNLGFSDSFWLIF